VSWSNAKLSPATLALLDQERHIGVLPAAARARALARARAALVAGVTWRPIPSMAWLAVRWTAVGLICVATGAAAYEVSARMRLSAQPVAAALLTESPGSEVKEGAHPAIDRPVLSFRARTASRSGAAREELGLLQRARMAVARKDFASAIRLLEEHARRFGTGQLAEEREALRVRALAGLGRDTDARRAAADFEERFPRSPLLSTVEQMPDSP
jgi:hypothetical protein